MHAVANTEHRNAQLEYRQGRAHIGRVENRLGPARKNNAFGSEGPQCLHVDVEGADFGIHTGFAHPAGDELCVLGAEIQDQDAVRMDVRMLRVCTKKAMALNGFLSVHPVVRGFLGDGDVVHVTFPHAGTGDAHQLGLFTHLGQGGAAGITHAGAQAPVSWWITAVRLPL